MSMNSDLKVGDIVRFRPSFNYVNDWLNTKLGLEPEALGQVVALPPKRRARAWADVVFPPYTGPWLVPSEDLEKVYEPPK